jgi:hypothetical protein
VGFLNVDYDRLWRAAEGMLVAADQERLSTGIRTGLIGYGIIAYGYFVARPASPESGSATAYLLSGVGVQILLAVARMLVKRRVTDQDIARQSLFILELVGDAATVFLFALGTFHATVLAPDAF